MRKQAFAAKTSIDDFSFFQERENQGLVSKIASLQEEVPGCPEMILDLKYLTSYLISNTRT